MERIETDNVHKIWFLCGRNIDVHQEGVIFYTLTSDYTQEQIDNVDPNAAETARVIYDRGQWTDESYRSNPYDLRLDERIQDGLILESSLTSEEYERRVLRNTWKEESRQAEQALSDGVVNAQDKAEATGAGTNFLNWLGELF